MQCMVWVYNVVDTNDQLALFLQLLKFPPMIYCLLSLKRLLIEPLHGKTICIGKNKGADQLRSNCEADQRLCFRYTDSMITLLLKSKISSFYHASVTIQPGLCRTW